MSAVRINLLYTQTINTSSDLPASLKPLCYFSVLSSIQTLRHTIFVLFIIQKKKKKVLHQNSWSGSTLSFQWHLSPASSEYVNQKSKSQTEEALNCVIRGRRDFQLPVHGIAFLTHQRIVLSVTNTHSPC